MSPKMNQTPAIDQKTLWKLANAISSLSDSTHIRVRVPFGPIVEVNGRNGKRPSWRVWNSSVPDSLDAFFIGDNGKYILIASPYYEFTSSDVFDRGIELVKGILPYHAILPIFRGVKDIFMFSDTDVVSKFLPNSTINVCTVRPYVEILKEVS